MFRRSMVHIPFHGSVEFGPELVLFSLEWAQSDAVKNAAAPHALQKSQNQAFR